MGIIYDVIIIGAGPAGMTAALYARRAGKSAIILEGSGIGGQIAFSPAVENYPAVKRISGMELSDLLFLQATDAGAEIAIERVTSIKDGVVKTVITEDGEHYGKSIIIATGVRHRPLGLSGENDLVGRGISYCALCDGPYYKDGIVAVAGGGNSALGEALNLSNYCKKVYLIHRRDVFSGETSILNRLKQKENVEILPNTKIISLNGEGSLSSLTVQNNASSDLKEINADCLFVAVGHMPQNQIFDKLCTLDEGGYIVTDESCRTNASGVFAAGDCRKKQIRQLTTAVSDGTVAAAFACKYIDSIKEN